MNMGSLFITGCSSGVGYVTALAFRAAGFENLRRRAHFRPIG